MDRVDWQHHPSGGASASHTMVTWNGININSPMLGQLDFSLIPASFLDEVEVFYCSGSIRDLWWCPGRKCESY